MRRYAHRTSVVEYLAKTRRTENSFFFFTPKKWRKLERKCIMEHFAQPKKYAQGHASMQYVRVGGVGCDASQYALHAP